MQWDRRAVVYGSTDVVCDQDHQFLNNSVGQNPCLIYAYTVGSCASVFVQVQSLNQSTTYPPPSGNPNLGIQSASECTCGRVPYNLISACSTCQGKSVLSFSSHVPAGSALPVWATRQANATKFVWDTALNDKGYGEFLPSGSSGNASVTQTGVSGPSQVPQSPFEHGSTVDNSAAVGLATTAVILALFIAGAFIYFWRRMTTARTQTDKSSATGSQASTLAHSGE
ncbi:hypothetical protein FRC19_001986 [Serendipita sp. 401]|nr:hypothetical protein FRC19_001986 [Serendipita sp. 401]